MKNILEKTLDGHDTITYEQAMRALERARAAAKDDDLHVVLLFLLRGMQTLLEK